MAKLTHRKKQFLRNKDKNHFQLGTEQLNPSCSCNKQPLGNLSRKFKISPEETLLENEKLRFL